jgi:hypoxanthine phosphoribosyltransferase
VLLVDDVNDTGDTLLVATRHLQTFRPADVRTAVVHEKTVSRIAADYFAMRIVRWRWLIYPWAVNEDVRGFLKRMTPIPESSEDAQKLLAERFNIKITLQRLNDIYASMNL